MTTMKNMNTANFAFTTSCTRHWNLKSSNQCVLYITFFLDYTYKRVRNYVVSEPYLSKLNIPNTMDAILNALLLKENYS